MAKLNIAKFQEAFVAAGKKLFTSNLELVASHGTVSVADPMFGGKRKGEFGDFIMLKNADGSSMIVSVDKGCPAGVSTYEIRQFIATEDYEKMKKGDTIFKAFGIVEEEE
jgi:hypothetical protein